MTEKKLPDWTAIEGQYRADVDMGAQQAVLRVAKPRYTLDGLLARCRSGAALTTHEHEWLECVLARRQVKEFCAHAHPFRTCRRRTIAKIRYLAFDLKINSSYTNVAQHFILNVDF